MACWWGRITTWLRNVYQWPAEQTVMVDRQRNGVWWRRKDERPSATAARRRCRGRRWFVLCPSVIKLYVAVAVDYLDDLVVGRTTPSAIDLHVVSRPFRTCCLSCSSLLSTGDDEQRSSICCYKNHLSSHPWTSTWPRAPGCRCARGEFSVLSERA